MTYSKQIWIWPTYQFDIGERTPGLFHLQNITIVYMEKGNGH